MRMQIKHNVYFKNPKFVIEVTHSKSISGKTSNQGKIDLFFLLVEKFFLQGSNTVLAINS